MKEVVAAIQPFDFQQNIYMFEDGHLKMQLSATMRDIAERVFKACQYDDVKDVTLKGNIDFTAKIKEEIRNYELTEYGAKKLNITLVP